MIINEQEFLNEFNSKFNSFIVNFRDKIDFETNIEKRFAPRFDSYLVVTLKSKDTSRDWIINVTKNSNIDSIIECFIQSCVEIYFALLVDEDYQRLKRSRGDLTNLNLVFKDA